MTPSATTLPLLPALHAVLLISRHKRRGRDFLRREDVRGIAPRSRVLRAAPSNSDRRGRSRWKAI
eukprot:341713-Prymnesium_polylepis.1